VTRAWISPLLFVATVHSHPPNVAGRQVDRVIAAHPNLRDRVACVERVRDTLPEGRRSDAHVARAALEACVPRDPWVRVFTGEPPKTARRPGSTYVDRSRLVVEAGQTVRFWVLVEHFDETGDFYLAEWVLDCTTGLTAPVQQTTVTAGQPGELERAESRWKDARESYQGIAVMQYVCGTEETRLAILLPSSRPSDIESLREAGAELRPVFRLPKRQKAVCPTTLRQSVRKSFPIFSISACASSSCRIRSRVSRLGECRAGSPATADRERRRSAQAMNASAAPITIRTGAARGIVRSERPARIMSQALF
jgi:hypothetical protein